MLLIVQLPRAVLICTFAPSTKILISVGMSGALTSSFKSSQAGFDMFLGLATTKKVELLVRKMQVRFQLRISSQAILEAKVLLINNSLRRQNNWPRLRVQENEQMNRCLLSFPFRDCIKNGYVENAVRSLKHRMLGVEGYRWETLGSVCFSFVIRPRCQLNKVMSNLNFKKFLSWKVCFKICLIGTFKFY